MNGFKSLKRRCVLIFVTVCLGVLTFAGQALADNTGPAYSQFYPANGATVFQAKVMLAVTAVDPDQVDMASLVTKVDGAQVNYIASYAPIDESTDDYTTMNIYIPASLAPGVHSASVTVKDNYGNTGSTTWSFTVAQPAKILNLSPANGATVVNRQPVITAFLSAGAGINPATLVMTMNDTRVNAFWDQVSGTISYTPPAVLDNETFYNMSLSFKDTGGSTVNATWQFYVNTFNEMAFSADDTTCQRCHDRVIHPVANCAKCHGTNPVPERPNYPIDDCYKCHYNASYPASWHDGGLPQYYEPSHPIEATASCIACHNQPWTSTVIPTIHNVFDTAVAHKTTTTGCSDCHSTSLTREHQRRLDAEGNPLNCFTCHNNPDPKIKAAIVNKDSSCQACHGIASHPGHNNGLDANCQTCHSATILEDTQFHANNSCAVCHESSDPLVNYNISNGDTSCFACHNQGHGVNFVRQTPADIPLYPGFAWSFPQDTAVWADEPWFPEDFKTAWAKIIISDRRSDVSGEDIFSWYNQELTANGWQKTAGPDQGSSYFTLAYQKGSRLCRINVYNGAYHDPAAPAVGFRIELLYK